MIYILYKESPFFLQRYAFWVARKKKSTPNRYRNEGFLEKLAAHCKRLREQKGYSIDRMAKEGEQLSTSVIHRLEAGKKPVTVLSLYRIAQVLALPITALMNFESDTPLAAPTPGHLRVISVSDPRVKTEAFKTLLPLYSIKAAAGAFAASSQDGHEPEGWVDASSVSVALDKRLFVIQVFGESMVPRIQSGDYIVLRASPAGTRQGKIVLAEYRGPADPDTGGNYTVKRYSSAKILSGDASWRHQEVRLEPLNTQFEPIVLHPKNKEDFRIIAEFVSILGTA